MSSAGRSHEGKPASPDSARPDEGIIIDPAPRRQPDRGPADGHAATATAVASPSITSTDKADLNQTSTDQTSTDQTSTDQTSTDQTSTDQTSTDQTSTDQTSTDLTSSDKTSTDRAGVDETDADCAKPEPPGRRFARRRKNRGEAVPDQGVIGPPEHAGPARRAFSAVGRSFRRAAAPVWVRHVALLLIYIGAGIAATWPRFTYLIAGKLPKTTDVAAFVWGMWWVAHQVVHLGNPFFTRYMAAPVGVQLGFSTLMPLGGIVMTPVTLLWGPSASFTALSLIVPGLLCYTMFRAARLWLNVPGAIAAGAFFGLSSMMLWQNWYHINIAAGLIFLPVIIEAAIRLRRTQKLAPAIWLGAALGAAVMTSQEGAAIALLITIVILVPWMLGKLFGDRASLRRVLLPMGIGAVVALVLASPQLIAMAQQIASGGAKVPLGTLARNYTQFGVPLQTLFSPSPRLSYYGLGNLGSGYAYGAAKAFNLTSPQPMEGLPTFGIVASGLALLGVVVGFRKRTTWWFLLLWAGCALLALGTSVVIGSSCVVDQIQPGKLYGKSCHQYLPLLSHIHWTFISSGGVSGWQKVLVSNLMPYTWLVRIPGLAGLREADRFTLVGMIGVALLAGLVVEWLSKRRRWLAMPLIAVVIGLGVLESGWAGGADGPPFTPTETMPTTMPAFDAPLIADHSNSVVLDVPFGLRGGLSLIGSSLSERSLVLATEDQHPRAVSYTAWVPRPTIQAIEAHPFYLYLMKFQSSRTFPTRPELAAAAADLKTLNIGWVIEWANLWRVHHPLLRLSKLETYLRELGFRRYGLTCLVPSKPGTICGHHPLEKVRLLQYVPKDAYTNSTSIR
jgi:hypothetical protein